jgi:hypothetical protein
MAVLFGTATTRVYEFDDGDSPYFGLLRELRREQNLSGDGGTASEVATALARLQYFDELEARLPADDVL